MIYIENKDGVQRVVIPTNDTNVEYVNFVPQEGDSNYYTKTQTDEKIAQSRTSVLGEVGDWLSHYPTTDQMHDAIEEAVKDLEPGDDTTEYATLDDLRGLANIVNNNDMKLSQTMLVTTSGEDMCETNLVTGPSGTYIPFKTVNGESIVGHGDVEVGAGGGYLFRATEYSDRSTPTAVELVDRSLGELFDDLQNNRNVNVSLFEYDYLTISMQGYEYGGDVCTIYFSEPTQFVIVTFDTTAVQDVTCVPISDVVGPSAAIITLSANMNLPVDAFNRLHNANQNGTVGVLIQNNTAYSVVSSNATSITLMGKDSLVIYTNTNGVITKTTMTLVDKTYVDEAIANMPSGGGSGVKVYEALWDDAGGNGYTRVTNQMVYDMFNDYSNGLTVQLKYNDMLLTVYFAKQEAPYCYVYLLAANIMAEFAGYINYPSDNAAYSEQPFVTREVFDKAIPHKYDYTITDDIALTGYFSQGEGYELFNDVRDGADVNFKLIMFEGQSKYIPFSINYDRYMDKVNFMFLDYGRYIMGTLESNGNMSIGTENFN